MKTKLLLLPLLLVLSACGSLRPAQCLPVNPPAWVMQPAPNLTPLLDQLITPSETGSPDKPSS